MGHCGQLWGGGGGDSNGQKSESKRGRQDLAGAEGGGGVQGRGQRVKGIGSAETPGRQEGADAGATVAQAPSFRSTG